MLVQKISAFFASNKGVLKEYDLKSGENVVLNKTLFVISALYDCEGSSASSGEKMSLLGDNHLNFPFIFGSNFMNSSDNQTSCLSAGARFSENSTVKVTSVGTSPSGLKLSTSTVFPGSHPLRKRKEQKMKAA
jgi:hypothetical protein